MDKSLMSVEELRSALEAAEQQLTQKTDEVIAYASELADFDEVKSALETEIESLKKDLDRSVKAQENLLKERDVPLIAGKLKERNAEVDKLKKKLEALARRAPGTVPSSSSTEVEKLRKKVGELEEENKKKEEQADNLQEEAFKKLDEIRRLEAAKNKSDEFVKSVGGQLGILGNSISALKKEINEHCYQTEAVECRPDPDCLAASGFPAPKPINRSEHAHGISDKAVYTRIVRDYSDAENRSHTKDEDSCKINPEDTDILALCRWLKVHAVMDGLLIFPKNGLPSAHYFGTDPYGYYRPHPADSAQKGLMKTFKVYQDKHDPTGRRRCIYLGYELFADWDNYTSMVYPSFWEDLESYAVNFPDVVKSTRREELAAIFSNTRVDHVVGQVQSEAAEGGEVTLAAGGDNTVAGEEKKVATKKQKISPTWNFWRTSRVMANILLCFWPRELLIYACVGSSQYAARYHELAEKSMENLVDKLVSDARHYLPEVKDHKVISTITPQCWSAMAEHLKKTLSLTNAQLRDSKLVNMVQARVVALRLQTFGHKFAASEIKKKVFEKVGSDKVTRYDGEDYSDSALIKALHANAWLDCAVDRTYAEWEESRKETYIYTPFSLKAASRDQRIGKKGRKPHADKDPVSDTLQEENDAEDNLFELINADDANGQGSGTPMADHSFSGSDLQAVGLGQQATASGEGPVSTSTPKMVWSVKQKKQKLIGAKRVQKKTPALKKGGNKKRKKVSKKELDEEEESEVSSADEKAVEDALDSDKQDESPWEEERSSEDEEETVESSQQPNERAASRKRGISPTDDSGSPPKKIGKKTGGGKATGKEKVIEKKMKKGAKPEKNKPQVAGKPKDGPSVPTWTSPRKNQQSPSPAKRGKNKPESPEKRKVSPKKKLAMSVV